MSSLSFASFNRYKNRPTARPPERPLEGLCAGEHAESLLRVLLNPGCSLVLGGNPWECPPAAVVAAGESSIRGYYDELKRSARGPMKIQSLKVVLAGHGGAGKTRCVHG